MLAPPSFPIRFYTFVVAGRNDSNWSLVRVGSYPVDHFGMHCQCTARSLRVHATESTSYRIHHTTIRSLFTLNLGHDARKCLWPKVENTQLRHQHLACQFQCTELHADGWVNIDIGQTNCSCAWWSQFALIGVNWFLPFVANASNRFTLMSATLASLMAHTAHLASLVTIRVTVSIGLLVCNWNCQFVSISGFVCWMFVYPTLRWPIGGGSFYWTAATNICTDDRLIATNSLYICIVCFIYWFYHWWLLNQSWQTL